MKAMDVLTKLVVGLGRFGDHLLSRKFSGVIVASLALACGAGLVYALRRVPQTSHPEARYVSPPPCAFPTPDAAADFDKEEWDTPELEDWKNRRAGVPLRLDYDSMPNWAKPSESKVVVLPSGRTLAAAGGTLYMLGADGRVVWTYDTPHDVVNFVYVKATGVVYSTDNGNNMSIIDAATGGVLRGVPRGGGRIWYGAMLPYGEDTCLIMDKLGSYRMEYRSGDVPAPDGVTAWRGTRMLWRAEVPPDSELQFVGEKIYAVTKTRSKILVKEIKPPKGHR